MASSQVCVKKGIIVLGTMLLHCKYFSYAHIYISIVSIHITICLPASESISRHLTDPLLKRASTNPYIIIIHVI